MSCAKQGVGSRRSTSCLEGRSGLLARRNHRHRHLASTLRVFHAISMPAEAKRALLGRTYMVGAGEGGGAQHGGAHAPLSAEAFAMTRWQVGRACVDGSGTNES